jgi:adenylylsulfate kinase
MSSGPILWFTGVPSSGKSTLARSVQGEIAGVMPTILLDGDEVRAALVPRPGYEPEARDAFYATLGRLALLLSRQGAAVLIAATAHRRAYRDFVREAAERFIEVHLDVSREQAESQDLDKSLYRRARAGQLPGGMPGLDLAYEPPSSPEVIARGGADGEALLLIKRLSPAPGFTPRGCRPSGL